MIRLLLMHHYERLTIVSKYYMRVFLVNGRYVATVHKMPVLRH